MHTGYSPVMPVALWHSLIEYQEQHLEEEVLGDYFLLLAHDVLDHPKEYAEIFADRARVPKDSFVILDNSVIETGTPFDVEYLLAAANIVHADCIILPDVLENAHATIRVAKKAYETLMLEPGYSNIPLMGVIQGRDIVEMQWCAMQYASMPFVQYYGCPRWVANKIGSRMIFKNILGIEHAVKDRVVHMLGMSSDPYDDITCASLPGIMGIDSANPIVMGQMGIEFYPYGGNGSIHYPRKDSTTGFDYWQETQITSTSIRNIKEMRSLINGDR